MADAVTEFAARLRQAIDAHPNVPSGQYGRLTWLQRELERVGVSVSVNTAHKWYHGRSLPRPDKIQTIAGVLKVDDVWLTLGRSPHQHAAPAALQVGRANGAVLLLAGLIEMAGGRVTFPSEGSLPHFHVNLGAARFGAIVVQTNKVGTKVSCLVPEPTGASRVLAVSIREGANMPTAAFDLYDITGFPRRAFGGYSSVEFEASTDRTLATADGSMLEPLTGVRDLGDLAVMV